MLPVPVPLCGARPPPGSSARTPTWLSYAANAALTDQPSSLSSTCATAARRRLQLATTSAAAVYLVHTLAPSTNPIPCPLPSPPRRSPRRSSGSSASLRNTHRPRAQFNVVVPRRLAVWVCVFVRVCAGVCVGKREREREKKSVCVRVPIRVLGRPWRRLRAALARSDPFSNSPAAHTHTHTHTTPSLHLISRL